MRSLLLSPLLALAVAAPAWAGGVAFDLPRLAFPAPAPATQGCAAPVGPATPCTPVGR